MAISRKECTCKWCHQTDSLDMDFCFYRVVCMLCLRVEGYEDFMWRMDQDLKKEKK